MFRARTILVVGAGASAEFDFPLGGDLLKEIAQKIEISYRYGQLERGDHIIADALREVLDARTDVTNYNEHLHSAWQVVASSKQGISIDNVLHALEDEKASRVGKFGIVRSILAAEKKSSLSKWSEHQPDQIDIQAFGGTWLSALTRILTEGRPKSKISEIFDNLTIVNFNYDRIIEQYLPFAIAGYYGVNPGEIRDLMSTLPILRPYGRAGSLPWENKSGAVPFGQCGSKDVATAAEQILTFTEQVENEELKKSIGKAFREADRIVFLGFGYHQQNIELLSSQCRPHVQILGTSLAVSGSDKKVISDELEKLFYLSENSVNVGHEYVQFHDLRCSEFVNEVWRTLMAGPSESPVLEFPDYDAYRTLKMPSF